MTDDQKFDPFKPAQPKIPGVPASAAVPDAEAEPAGPGVLPAGATPERETRKTPMWMFGAIGGAAVVLIVLGWILFRPAEPLETVPETGPVPVATGTAPESSAPSAPPASSLPIAPREDVATTAEMAKPWSAKKFLFRDNLGRETPALLVRLPSGYWAFSAVAPYGKCELEFISDKTKLKEEYGYNAQTPMVVDPCDKVVYNPMAYGSVRGAMVRGNVVQGPGFRPPRAIDVRVTGTRIQATQIEP